MPLVTSQRLQNHNCSCTQNKKGWTNFLRVYSLVSGHFFFLMFPVGRQWYSYLRGSVESFFEHGADAPELRHHFPAGPQFTRPRDTVALTLHLHVVQDSLGVHGTASVRTASDRSLSLQTIAIIIINPVLLAPTLRPASLLWRFMIGRPADSPLARSGSSTNV